MEDDIPNDDNYGGDVLVKKESDNEVDDMEIIPCAFLKRENDIDNRETIPYTSQRRESQDETNKKYIKNPNLKL